MKVAGMVNRSDLLRAVKDVKKEVLSHIDQEPSDWLEEAMEEYAGDLISAAYEQDKDYDKDELQEFVWQVALKLLKKAKAAVRSVEDLLK